MSSRASSYVDRESVCVGVWVGQNRVMVSIWVFVKSFPEKKNKRWFVF